MGGVLPPTPVPVSPGLVFSALAFIHSAPCHYLTPSLLGVSCSISSLLSPPLRLSPPTLSAAPKTLARALLSLLPPPFPPPFLSLCCFHITPAPIPLTGHHRGGTHQQTRSGESASGWRRRIEPRRLAGEHAASRCHDAGSRRRQRRVGGQRYGSGSRRYGWTDHRWPQW